MTKNIFLIFSFLIVMGCSTTDSVWLKEQDSNQFEIISGRTNDGRFLRINNTKRTWEGALKGEKEKVEAREVFLFKMIKAEAQRICGPEGHEAKSDVHLNMRDKNASAFGGGLLGELIADVASSYKNIPVAAYYEFKCNNEKNVEGELKPKK